MRKIIHDLIRFMPLFAVFYVLLVWGIEILGIPTLNVRFLIGGEQDPGCMYSRLKDLKSGNYRDVDVLFCGSSHAYRGFDVRLFREAGYRSFNLGSSDQTPVQTLYLLEKYVDELSPKLVVFEVYPETFTIKGVEASCDLISKEKVDLSICKMCLSTPSIICLNTLIYSVLYDVFVGEKVCEEENEGYVHGGFVEYSEGQLVKPEGSLGTIELAINETQMRALGQCVELLRSKGIAFLFVESPITEEMYRAYSGHEAFEERLSAYGPYWNYNGRVVLNDSLHFYDRHHLKQAGVDVFNERLIQDLRKGNWLTQ